MDTKKTLKVLQPGVVRVFISSTFKDMREEREELVKFTFPELRKRCRERQVEFVDVDLRWGITDEQKAEGKVLPICLSEIEKCRPYFIGILGERYGWIKKDMDKTLLETWPWLREQKEKSVTELEILHGVLNDPNMEGLAFFYFRDPKSSNILETKLTKAHFYKPESDPNRLKLKALKDRIRESGYPVRENFPDARKLGKLVLDDLWEVISKKYPKDKLLSFTEREKQMHSAFARARTKFYIGREEYFKHLDRHVQEQGLPLVVVGESGSGKSALLANWAERYKKANPKDFVVLHFLGSSKDSTDYTFIIRRIIEEIWKKYPFESEEKPLEKDLPPLSETSGKISIDPHKLAEHFSTWIAKASARGRFILVLDGLDQLEDRDNAPELGWLPVYFPENVHIILSTLPGQSLDTIKRRNWPTFKVKNLNKEERKRFVVTYLSLFRKTLSPSKIDRIVSFNQTSNPIFLRIFLEELRIYGDHRTLKEKMDYYLQAATVDGIYKKILARYETDYERDRPGLVRDVLSFIWASRHGLSEKELLELLASDKRPLPAAYWSPLFLTLEESLVNRSGLLNFFHDYLRKAIEDRYLQTSEARINAHLRLADYFIKKELDDRKTDELPWQLTKAEDWPRLQACIASLDILLKLVVESRHFELLSYWIALKNRSDMYQDYKNSLEAFISAGPEKQDIAFVCHSISSFLFEAGKYKESEYFLRKAIDLCEKELGFEHPTMLNIHSELTRILASYAVLFKDSIEMEQQLLKSYEKVLGPEHPSTVQTLINVAIGYQNIEDYDKAEQLFRRALDIREKILGPDHPKTVSILEGIASLLSTKGKLDEAEILVRQVLKRKENSSGTDHPDIASSLSILGELYRRKADYKSGESVFRRALAIREKRLGPDHPLTATSLNNLGVLFMAKHDFKKALKFHKKALKIREKVFGYDHPARSTSMCNIAMCLQAEGKYETSEKLLKEAIGIEEKIFGVESLRAVKFLNELALMLLNKGDYREAGELFRRVLAVNLELLGNNHPDTASSQHSLGIVLFHLKHYEESEMYYYKALETRTQIFGKEHPDTATSLHNLAKLLYVQGDIKKAAPMMLDSVKIYVKTLGWNHPWTITALNSLSGLAHKLQIEGDKESSSELFKFLKDFKKNQ